MEVVGQRDRALLAAAGALAALFPAAFMWGFTVDDAFISIRYARHLAAGFGYRFNVNGPITDGVTPLGWPFVLAPLAGADALTVLFRAKLLGGACAVLGGAALGDALACARAETRAWHRALGLAAFALALPLAAHAVSGMETSLVVLLATLASTSLPRHPRVAAVLAGLAAALRPEMFPWALVVSLGGGRACLPFGPALAAAPFVAVALVRVAVFGRPAPLSLLAKPSDFAHGASYALAAGAVALAPILAFAPLALRRAPRAAQALAVAGFVHLVAVAAAGGDWMPYARLVAPIIPSLVYAFVLTAPHAHHLATLARAAVALAVGVYVAVRAAPAGRQVVAHRIALIDEARPFLAGARRIAALDIGWPTAASDADIVDLAGLTDPHIAVLPGGHTSKRIDAAMLLAREPDVLLLYVEDARALATLTAWRAARYTRAVEARLAASPLIAEHFEAAAILHLGPAWAGYVVLRRVR